MRILTGFRIQINRIAFGIDLALPEDSHYDFPILSIIFHECPKDYTLNFAIIGVEIHFSWIKELYGRRG